ncbi:MAG: Eco57I restriction-modification methylase domain-containing protein, partial [Planctomycetaceae bacterium]|nr:Eco57I restriction-modification methylase domain-containing protein [Planctomycetaceae bacterium]
LENEGKEAEGQLFNFSDMTLLPNIEDNIKCGNSLIGTDFYAQNSLLNEDEQFKINCFDWDKEFSHVFKQGGFDAVIGNPPYDVLTHDNKSIDYYKNNYKVCAGGKVNLYKLFFEQGLLYLLKNNGYFGFITPSNYLASGDSINLRNLLLHNQIIEIIDYEESDKVFKGVTQAVATIIIKKTADADYKLKYQKKGVLYDVEAKKVLLTEKRLIKGNNIVIDKLSAIKSILGDFVNGWQGEINVSTKKEYFRTKQKNGFLPLIRGAQISAYTTITKFVEFCPIKISAREHHKCQRVVIQEVANAGITRRLKGTILNNVLCGHTTNYLIPKAETKISVAFLLGLINSSLLNYYFKFFNQTNHVPIGEVKRFPFVLPDKAAHNNLVKLVNRMLLLKQRQNAEPNPQSKIMIQRQIDALDQQIDDAVYQLYGLTDDEIKIVCNN